MDASCKKKQKHILLGLKIQIHNSIKVKVDLQFHFFQYLVLGDVDFLRQCFLGLQASSTNTSRIFLKGCRRHGHVIATVA